MGTSIDNKLVEDCVVQIECINKNDVYEKVLGTGFFVEKNIIITASHVVNEYFRNPDEYEINVVPIKAGIDRAIKATPIEGYERNNFITILKLSNDVEAIKPMKFVTGYEIKRGDTYFTFGHPYLRRVIGHQIENVVSTTINSNQSKKADWDLKLNTDKLEDFRGFSGAPVIIEGMLVGVIQTQSDADAKAISIAMSSIDIIDEHIPNKYKLEYKDKKNDIINSYTRWIRDVNSKFVIMGLKKSLPIESSWMELNILNDKYIERDNKDNLKRIIESYREWGRARSSNKDVYKASDVSKIGDRIVIIGGPGAGKSTLCKKVVYQETNMLNNKTLFVRLPNVLKLLNNNIDFDSAIIETAIEGFKEKDKRLKDSLKDVEYLIADGLDECGCKRQNISELLNKWSLSRPKTKVIITTRPVGYDSSIFSEWTHVELLPIEDSYIDKYVEELLTDIYPDEYRRLQIMSNFKKQLEDNQVMSIASRSPMLLGFMIQLVTEGITLKNTRTDLYKQIVESWLNKIDRDTDTDLSETLLLRSLEIIGWELQSAEYNEDLRKKRKLIKSLGRQLEKELQLSRLRAAELAEKCIRYFEEQGILECIKIGIQDIYIFNHLNIGEYMAACYISNTDDENIKRFIKKNYMNPYWKEVILLAAGEGILDIIIDSLKDEEDNQNKEINFKCVTLMSECIIESGYLNNDSRYVLDKLLDGLQSNIPKVAYNSSDLLVKLNKVFNYEEKSKLIELLNSEQHWTYMATIQVYFTLENDDIDENYALEYILNYPLDSNYKVSKLFNGNEFKIDKGSILIDRNFELALRFLNKENSTQNIEDKLIELIDEGRLSIYMTEIIFKKARELGYVHVEERIEKIYSESNKKFMDYFMNQNINEKLKKSDITFLNSIKNIIDTSLVSKEEHNYEYLGKIFSILKGWDITPGEWILFGQKEDEFIYSNIIKIIVKMCNMNNENLLNEVISVFNRVEQGERLLSIIPRIPENLDYNRVKDVISDYTPFIRGIQHDSYIIRRISSDILQHGKLSENEISQVKEIFFSQDKELISILVVISKDLCEDEIVDLIISRLKQRLDLGCEYLYEIIPTLDKCIKDNRIYNILEEGLLNSKLKIAKYTAASLHYYDINSLVRIKDTINKSLKYWSSNIIKCGSCNIETNGSYCPKCRIVHDSPRSDLISILTKLDVISVEELILLSEDIRRDVRDTAINELGYIFNKDVDISLDIIIKIKDEKVSPQILKSILKMELRNLQKIKHNLIDIMYNGSIITRYNLIAALSDAKWISHDEVFKHLNILIKDSDESIRDISMITLEKRREFIYQI